MKKKIYIVLFFLMISIFFNQGLFAQNNVPIQASLTIKNVQLLDSNTLKFDLYMYRLTNSWGKLANATFQFVLYPNMSNIISVKLDTTDLVRDMGAGGSLPTNGYRQEAQLDTNRISITCLGPVSFIDCDSITKDPLNQFLIGSYTIKSSRYLEDFITWKTPVEYYQACAFKIAYDSMFYNDNEHLRYNKDDNVPLIRSNTKENSIIFSIDSTKRKYTFTSFSASYDNNLNNSLVFEIADDYRALGYRILRKYQTYPPNDPFVNDPDNRAVDTIFSYKTGSRYFNPKMICQGWNIGAHTYNGLYDSVQFRGGSYCYQLWVTLLENDGSEKDSLLERACAEVPALIIAQSLASPNPFERETTVNYELVEDAYITVEVWDAIGKKLDYLQDDNNVELDGTVIKHKGWNSVKFSSNKYLLSEGMYNIVISAVPVNPNTSIERGRAINKVHLLKGTKLKE